MEVRNNLLGLCPGGVMLPSCCPERDWNGSLCRGYTLKWNSSTKWCRGKHLLTEGLVEHIARMLAPQRMEQSSMFVMRNAIIKQVPSEIIRCWYPLNTWRNCTPWQWMQSTKSVDFIGHSKFLPWWQSMTRPFLSAKGVVCETRWQHFASAGLWLLICLLIVIHHLLLYYLLAHGEQYFSM